MNKKIKDLVEYDKVLISIEKEDKHYYGTLCRPNVMFPTWVKVLSLPSSSHLSGVYSFGFCSFMYN